MKEVMLFQDDEIESVMENWATNIEEKILWKLSKLNKPLKFIGTFFNLIFLSPTNIKWTF